METLRLPKQTITILHELAGLALEQLPMTFSASEPLPGRKGFFPIPMTETPNDMTDFLYVYVESKLTGEPKDADMGFTEDDIVEETGVYQFYKNGESVEGNTFSIDNLLLDIIDDVSLRNRIIFRINEMRSMIHLDEEFLTAVNADSAIRHDARRFMRLN